MSMGGAINRENPGPPHSFGGTAGVTAGVPGTLGSAGRYLESAGRLEVARRKSRKSLDYEVVIL